MNINDNTKQKILLKAWQDENFKKALIADPQKVLKDEFNIAIPGNVKVTVLEETDDQLYLIIPQKPPLPGCRGIIWFLPPKK